MSDNIAVKLLISFTLLFITLNAFSFGDIPSFERQDDYTTGEASGDITKCNAGDIMPTNDDDFGDFDDLLGGNKEFKCTDGMSGKEVTCSDFEYIDEMPCCCVQHKKKTVEYMSKDKISDKQGLRDLALKVAKEKAYERLQTSVVDLFDRVQKVDRSIEKGELPPTAMLKLSPCRLGAITTNFSDSYNKHLSEKSEEFGKDKDRITSYKNDLESGLDMNCLKDPSSKISELSDGKFKNLDEFSKHMGKKIEDFVLKERLNDGITKNSCLKPRDFHALQSAYVGKGLNRAGTNVLINVYNPHRDPDLDGYDNGYSQIPKDAQGFAPKYESTYEEFNLGGHYNTDNILLKPLMSKIDDGYVDFLKEQIPKPHSTITSLLKSKSYQDKVVNDISKECQDMKMKFIATLCKKSDILPQDDISYYVKKNLKKTKPDEYDNEIVTATLKCGGSKPIKDEKFSKIYRDIADTQFKKYPSTDLPASVLGIFSGDMAQTDTERFLHTGSYDKHQITNNDITENSHHNFASMYCGLFPECGSDNISDECPLKKGEVFSSGVLVNRINKEFNLNLDPKQFKNSQELMNYLIKESEAGNIAIGGLGQLSSIIHKAGDIDKGTNIFGEPSPSISELFSNEKRSRNTAGGYFTRGTDEDQKRMDDIAKGIDDGSIDPTTITTGGLYDSPLDRSDSGPDKNIGTLPNPVSPNPGGDDVTNPEYESSPEKSSVNNNSGDSTGRTSSSNKPAVSSTSNISSNNSSTSRAKKFPTRDVQTKDIESALKDTNKKINDVKKDIANRKESGKDFEDLNKKLDDLVNRQRNLENRNKVVKSITAPSNKIASTFPASVTSSPGGVDEAVENAKSIADQYRNNPADSKGRIPASISSGGPTDRGALSSNSGGRIGSLAGTKTPISGYINSSNIDKKLKDELIIRASDLKGKIHEVWEIPTIANAQCGNFSIYYEEKGVLLRFKPVLIGDRYKTMREKSSDERIGACAVLQSFGYTDLIKEMSKMYKFEKEKVNQKDMRAIEKMDEKCISKRDLYKRANLALTRIGSGIEN